MDHDVFPNGTTSEMHTDAASDFDFMDELLSDGWWFQTANESELLHRSPSNLNASFDASCLWSASPATIADLGRRPLLGDTENEEQSMNITTNDTQGRISLVPATVKGVLGPGEAAGSTSRLMEKFHWAVECIRASAVDKDTLIQIWAPVSKEGMRFLTTNGQPFSLEPCSPTLASYRNVSVNYQFAAQKDSNESLGLPGRVYLGKVPEWTPDVRFFRKDEFRRVEHARQYNISGTLALPVFERDSTTCVGVVEVVMTDRKINYRPELERVCRALEAVDLRGFGASNTGNIQGSIGAYQVIPEILELLRPACVKHGLPLAQTWVRCSKQDKCGYWHSDDNCLTCVCTLDSACYVTDPQFQGFHEACSEYHLFKGQGVAGEAFTTNQPCFSPDITSFKKTEYPLSHHARLFGLRAAVAIRLRSIYTGSDFVLEFFLPLDCSVNEDQKTLLCSLSIIIQQASRSLRVIADKELEEERGLLVAQEVELVDGRSRSDKLLKVEKSNDDMSSPEESFWGASLMEVRQSGDLALVPGKEKQKKVLNILPMESTTMQNKSTAKGGAPHNSEGSSLGKGGEKRRTKAEKVITLQVLQQYFAGSLKDAAKNLGVCPTTLKRICRQHGINRWPSRKIKKVGHSLQKLQLVIDSVRGASGALEIGSVYPAIPKLAPRLPQTGSFKNLEQTNNVKPPNVQPLISSSQNLASRSPSSSCTPSSSSSHSCSIETQKPSSDWDITVSSETMIGESSADGISKRVRSDIELLVDCQEGSDELPTKMVNVFTKCTEFDPPPVSSVPVVVRDSWRVKVAYGEENIRLRMQSNWNVKDLMQEIGKRFKLDDTGKYHLKYLDDESEWVTLTCDADLEECIDVSRSMQSDTIKLILLDSSQLRPSSWGSSGIS